MPVYQIMGRNGKLYQIEGPPGVTKDQIKAKILARAPEAGLPPQDRSPIEDIPVVGGALAAAADIPLSAVQALAGTGKSVSDLFGPGNAVSDVLSGIAEGTGRLKSAGSKEDAAISAAEQKSAEDKGVLEQIKAAGRAVGRAPLETTASVVGSAIPFIAASVTGGLPAAAALGAASGVGMIKGAIYDAVQEELLKTGKVTPEQAAAAAEKAQEYGGENTDMQALGGIIGAAAAATGLPKSIAGRLGSQAAAKVAAQVAARETAEKAALATLPAGATAQVTGKAAPGLARSAITGAVAEAAPEGLAAGQERAAQNIALQREGFDVDPMKGVAGQAAFEAISSLIPGAAGKVYETAPQRAAGRAVPPPTTEEETSELNIPSTISVDPEVTLGRLSEAAGLDISPAARIAVEALNRRVANDLSLSTAESLDASRAFITAREDDIASGTFPEDIAGPYANALAEAKRMLEEVVPATTQATIEPELAAELAPVTAPTPAVSGFKTAMGSTYTVDEEGRTTRNKAKRDAPGHEADFGRKPTSAKTVYVDSAEQAASLSAAGLSGLGEKGARVVIKDDKATLLTWNDKENRWGTTPSSRDIPVYSEPAVGRAPLELWKPTKDVPGNEAYRGMHAGNLITEMVMPAAPEVAAEPAPEPTPTPAPPEIGSGTGSFEEYLAAARASKLAPTAAPEPAAPEPAAPEPVSPVPPTPPPPTDGEPSAAIPEPTLPPQRAELQTPNKWLVKLADRFGMSAPLDAFVKANLGYESLPEALETTSKLELSTSRQAGKVRNLQRNFFNPIVDTSANLKADLGDFGFFLWARGAADRNRLVAESNPQEFPEGGSGLLTAKAAEGLQELKDEGKLPAFNQLARKVDELVDFNLEEDIKAGLLSREGAKELRRAQPFYVPLKGFAKDGDMLTADVDEGADAPARQAEAMRAIQSAAPTGSVREFRRAFGRGDMPFHPLFNLFQDSEARVRRREMNMALLPTLRAYKQNPAAFEGILNVYSAANPKQVKMGRDIPGGRWEPVPNMEQEYYRNRDKYMMVKENGVPHYIEFAEQGPGAEVKRMFANMKSEDLKGAMKTMADINNFMKGMLTYKNPLYLLTVAPLRDTSAAIATALANQNIKGSPAFGKNLAAWTLLYSLPFSGTGSAVGRYVFGKAPMTDATGQLLQEMIDAGGTPLQSRFMNAQEKAGAAARAIKTMQGIENLSPKERAANLLDGLNRWIDGLADIMDMNARFATYRAATGLGIEPTDAARLALDSSLNLTRRGEMARSLDIALPFFGAGVEASRKTARILTNPKALTKVFGSMIVLGVLESLWNAGQSGDDDEDGQENYLDQDRAGLRMNRLIIYHGSRADDYWKIPIDPMLGYFKFVGNKIGDVMAGTASPSESANGLVPGFVSLMSPLRVPGTDVQSLAVAAMPLMGKPFVENIMNQNFFRSPIYKERAFDNAPRSELGRETTGDFWKGLAKVINAAGGGSEAVSSPYGVDFQPEVYRHIIESYFGGPYQLAKQMVGLKEAEGIADVPGIKSFVGTGSEYAPQSKYFANTATVRQIMNRLSKLTPEQQARQGEKYFEDTDPRIMDAFKAVEANLDRINKEQKASMALAKSDEDRQVVLDYYRKQKNQYYSAFNYTYNATKRGE